MYIEYIYTLITVILSILVLLILSGRTSLIWSIFKFIWNLFFKKKRKENDQEESIDIQYLRATEYYDYSRQYLLNKTEKEIYWILVRELNSRYCINPQASLGEILKSSEYFAYRAINSKRSDFVITTKKFLPVAVVEYQGSGHFQNNHEIRTQIKKNALEKAGILFIELFDLSEEHIKQQLSVLWD